MTPCSRWPRTEFNPRGHNFITVKSLWRRYRICIACDQKERIR